MVLLWLRFEKWLEGNAPHLLQQLNKGATQTEIDQLETLIDKKLPDDFIEFYKIHNGQQYSQEGIINHEQLLSIEYIIGHWENWEGLLCEFENEDDPITSEPDEGVKDNWWNPLWIPFTHDGSGNNICIDLDPSKQGHFGQVIRMWHDSSYRELYASSFTEWFENYISGLEAGKFVYAEGWGLVDKDSPFNRH
jgi:cell wall assembly regulator SMI1